MASSAPSPLRERPIQFGKYTLLARIASGGMGELYLAQLRSAGGFAKLVVIKRILSHLTDKPEFVELFVAEARTAARISHPNVCQIYELGQVDGRYYMALEYLEGVSLAEVMVARKKAPQMADLRLIASLVGQAAEGLHHAHSLRNADGESANVVHRDVNPRNVFVTSAGVAKVLDFGIVRVRGALSQIQTGAVKGTYSYMAPEQLQGESVDCTADIFSLGTMTWEAVVGRRLFKRSSDLLTWRAIVEEPIPRPTQFRPDLPPELDEAIMRALRRAPAERYQSAREFSAALEQAVHPLGATLTTLAIAEEMEKAFATELGKQRERVFAAHRRQSENLVAAGPDASMEEMGAAAEGAIDDWFGGGSHTRVADPDYPDLVAKMVTARSQQIGVPVEPFADMASDSLELTEEVVPRGARRPEARDTEPSPVALPPPSSLPELPPPPAYVVDDQPRAVAPSEPLPDLADMSGIGDLQSVADGPNDEDDEDDLLIRPRRRWPVVVALSLSAATGAALVLLLNSGPDKKAEVERPPESAASVVAARPDALAAVPPRSAPGPTAAPAEANRAAAPPAKAPSPTPAVTRIAPAEPEPAEASAKPADDKGADEKRMAATPGTDKAKAKAKAKEAGRATRESDDSSRRDRARESRRDRRDKSSARDGRKQRSANRESTKQRRRTAQAEARSASRGDGFLTVNAEPYATLYVDGKKLGVTPVVRLVLPPGSHRLRLVSSSGQPEKKMRVKIVAGQELRKFVKW